MTAHLVLRPALEPEVRPPHPVEVQDALPAAGTARELAMALGSLELDHLQRFVPELAAAVAELAATAGKPWPFGADEPVVLLLRALAKLSIDAPSAASARAAALMELVAPGPRGRLDVIED